MRVTGSRSVAKDDRRVSPECALRPWDDLAFQKRRLGFDQSSMHSPWNAWYGSHLGQ